MTDILQRVLDRLTHIGGVRGAVLVSADDGIVVTESLMEGVRGGAVAALAASLARRWDLVGQTVHAGSVRFLHVEAERGLLAIVPARQGMLIVVIGGTETNVGLVRLEMLRAVDAVA